MAWLGVRCWKDKIAMAAVDDSGAVPEVIFQRRDTIPKGESDFGRQAQWFCRVVEEALTDCGAEGLAIYVSGGRAEQVRASFEGAAAVAGGTYGVPVRLMRRQNLWKTLGLTDFKKATWDYFIKQDDLMSGLVGEIKEAAAVSLAAQRRETA